MKKKILIGMLGLAMALSVTACSSKTEDSTSANASQTTEEVATEEASDDTEEASTTETSEAETDSESATAEDQDDKRNDLPVGCISDDGYYNSYFGFKIEVADAPAYSGYDLVMRTFELNMSLGMKNEIAIDSLDPDYEAAANAFSNFLESNGEVYTFGDNFAVGLTQVKVCKLDGKSLEDQITEDKAGLEGSGDYRDIVQSSMEICGESKECLTYSSNYSNRVGIEIYYVKDNYVCSIDVSGASSLEDACGILEAF